MFAWCISRRRLTLPAIAMAAAIALAACGSSSDTGTGDAGDAVAWAQQNVPGIDSGLVDAACNEGELSAYHMVYRDDLRPLLDAFQNRFPCIKVTGFSATASELLERLRSEQGAGRYLADVFQTTTPGEVAGLRDEGIVTEYTPPNADRVPSEFKEEGLFYATGFDPIGIAWNTDVIKPDQKAVIDSINNWSQVANPVFKGDTGMVNARSGGTAQIAWWYFQQKLGPNFYKEIAALDPVFFDATRPSVDRLVAGDFSYLMHAPVDNSVASAWVNGAPVEWKFPEPGLAVPAVTTVLAKAPHPNAARLFEIWSLTREGQTEWSKATGLAPVNSDVDDPRPQSKESWYHLPTQWLKIDWVALSKNVPSTIDEFQQVFNQ